MSARQLPWIAWCVALGAAVPCLAADPKPSPAEAGLVATYSDGKQTVVQLVPTPDFVLKADESIHPQLPAAFTAEWAGVLHVLKKGKYTIGADARVTLDGQPAAGKPVELDAGDHLLAIAYARKPGPARLQLTWQSDDFVAEPIPSSAFGHKQLPPAAEQSAAIERGRELVEELNCVACHKSSSTSLVGRPAPDLTRAGSRLRESWIGRWLANPREFRPDAAMPHAPLSDADCRDAADYLATLKDPKPKYKDQPLDAKRVAQGKELFEKVGCTACHTGAALSLAGLGSKWAPAQLVAYLENPLAVDPSGRMPGMLLTQAEATSLVEYLTQSRRAEYEVNTAAAGTDGTRGVQVVRTAGCANCHALPGEGGKPAPAGAGAMSVALEKLAPDKGCLAAAPSGKAMDYGLTAEQRGAIMAFVASVREHPLVSRAPGYEFDHAAAKFRCVACHELDEHKPADDGERVPPLTGAGSKLQRDWIRAVLTERRRSRPWFHRRMPEFGPQNVGGLPDAIVAASGAPEPEALPSPSREEIAAGQKLTGSKAGGLACITCHGFAGSQPQVGEDTRGPDLSTAASRIRPDHFRRWVIDPKRVMPTTPMPSFFADQPQAQALATVESIWRYVAMGEAMPPPEGWVDRNNYTLRVEDKPLVQRTQMPADGSRLPRAIAVGLPGNINYCFDADTCTLRYAWVGGFIDQQAQWSARGGGVAKVLGKRFFNTTLFPLRAGDLSKEPDRAFVGYELHGGVPTFLYKVNSIDVRERVTAAEKGTGIVRTFELSGEGDPLSFVVAADGNLTYTASAGEFADAKSLVDAAGKPTAAKVLKLPAGPRATFAVTILAKTAP